MARLEMGSPGLAPNSVLDYIEDMLMELAEMAEVNGESALAGAIRRAAQTTPIAHSQNGQGQTTQGQTTQGMTDAFGAIPMQKPDDAA